MKIALVSMDQVWECKVENLKLCETYIQKASDEGVDLIVFPEMTLTGFSFNVSKVAEDKENSFTVAKFSLLAKKYSISILFGVVFKGDLASNNAIMIDRDGEIIETYVKIHPFTYAKEDSYFSEGDRVVTCKLHGLTIGLTICYDLRFPELYSILADSCDLIVNIANWPAKRVDHWNCLLKARAIENQRFIVGVNRVGTDGNKLQYCKSSQVINANGDTVKVSRSWKNMDICDLDINFTTEYQKTFNTYGDRKTLLYKQWMTEK